MPLRFFALLLFLLCRLPSLLQAQDYLPYVRHFGVEDGLSHRAVLAVFEDREGFIWAGTRNGLNRFDGHTFKWWTDEHEQGLFHNITSIGQDDTGWLWLFNSDRREFVFLNPHTEEILTQAERFPDFPLAGQNWFANDHALSTDKEGRLSFSTGKPAQLITYLSREGFRRVPLPEVPAFQLLFVDSQGRIWGNEGSTLYALDAQGRVTEKYPFIGCHDIYYVQELPGRNMCIRVREEEYGVDHNYLLDSTGHLHALALSPSEPTYFNVAQGFFWEFQDELWRVIDVNGQVLLALRRQDLPAQLFQEIIGKPYFDPSGRLWLSSQFGLNLVELKPRRFQTYFSYATDKKPFINSSRGMVVFGDTLLVNFEYGTLARTLLPDDQWQVVARGAGHSNTAAGRRLYWEWGRPLLPDGKGRFWSGHAGALLLLTAEGAVVEQHLLPPNPPEAREIWSLYPSGQRMWLGVDGGLLYWDVKQQSFQRLRLGNALDGATVLHMMAADLRAFPKLSGLQGAIWLCTDRGLFLFDPAKEQIIARYSNDGAPDGPYYLPATNVQHLHADAEGILWLATTSGLLRWNPATNERRLFTRRDGLSNETLYAVYEDRHGQLWLSSDYGIMQFDKSSYAVRTYLPEDGLSDREFNRISHLQAADGTIFFGSLNGITAFHPDSFFQKTTTYPTPLVITDFQQFDGASDELVTRTGLLRRTNTIVMQPGDPFFRIEFSLLTFENVDQIQYAYRVDGVDKDWNYQQEHSLRMGQLPYGDYTLRIKAQSADGIWSPDELAIRLIVVRPIYARWWFIGLMVGLLLTGVFGYLRWRTWQYEKNQRLLEQEIHRATARIEEDKETITQQAVKLRRLDEVKSRFFANVSHELRTPLTLLLSPLDTVLKNNRLIPGDHRMLAIAREGGKDLLKLIGSLLDLSKLESGKMEVQEQPTPFLPFLKRVLAPFESHAEHLGLALSFQYDLPDQLCLAIDRNKVEMVLNNLLSNAVKFTPPGGSIRLHAAPHGSAILIKVSDTGRGIHPNDLPYVFDRFYQSAQPGAPTEGGTGIGLALCRELAELLGGRIWVESSVAPPLNPERESRKGSVFAFEFPAKETFDSTVVPEEKLVSQAYANGGAQSELVRPVYPEDPSRAKVLVVEDNPQLREFLEVMLSRHYQVITAENGRAALDRLLQTKDCDLIISDVMMPVMDGFQLLETLKSDARYRRLPVVMLTARADMQDKLQALRIGVDDYLLKPFVEEELLARLANVLRNSRERSHYQQDDEAVAEESPPATAAQDQWLHNLETLVLASLTDPQFSTEFIADHLGLSRRQLQRRLQQWVGTSPNEYIREIRLHEARRLLESRRAASVKAAAAGVGYADVEYFSVQFRERFGKLPSEYLA